MFAGRVGSWDRLQYRVRIEPTMQVTNEESVSGVLTVPFAPALDSLAEFLKLTIALSVDNQGNITRTVTIVFGNTTWMRTDENVTASAQELILEFESPRWYVLDMPAWEFRWSGLRVYLNGEAVAHTLPTAGSVRNEYYFAPAGLPMSLAFINGSAHAGVGIGNPTWDCEAWSLLAETRVRVIGGWRVRETPTSPWIAFPIRVPQVGWHGDPCHNLTPDFPEVSGSDTWSATVSNFSSISVNNTDLGLRSCTCYCEGIPNGAATFHVFRQTSIIQSHEASMWIVPDLPRQFVALGSVPHEYLMYRHLFPQVGVQRTWQGVHTELRCGEATERTICNQSSDEPELIELHIPRDSLLSVHDGSASNLLNEPTGEPLYCPYSANVLISMHERAIACPVEGSNCPECFPPPDPGGGGDSFTTLTPPRGVPCCPFNSQGVVNQQLYYSEWHTWFVNDNCHPYYRHAEPAVRYWNTHAAPFWSYICWLQDWLLDRNGDGTPEPTPLADYWRPHQCQHIEHPALPSSVRTRRRSYLLLDALVHGTWSDWIYLLFGIPSGWVGSTRPALVEWLLPSEVTLTAESAPRWNATNATLAFGAGGISVTPTDTTHTLEFTLADWNAPPFVYPAVADRVRIWLPDTAYTSITIELVSAENETVPIATTRGTHPIPHGHDTKYAGTWARQYAAFATGYSEIGSDWDGDGVSSATFGDAARALLWQLLGARAGAKLRITITQTTPAPYTLSYPTFYRDAATEVIATDNGAHTFPHVRHPQTLNWGLLEYPIAGNTPSLRDPHDPMTLYDAAALYRQLERGLDASATIDIIDQIRAWGFDDVETGGHPAGVVRVRQMCRAAMLPYMAKLALWLINDLRECPALPTLPTRRFQLSPEFGFTGNWGQWCYFSAPSMRYYLAPDEPAKLMEIQDASETELTLYDRAVGRYHLTRQAVALDGTETLQHATKQWRIRAASRDLGRTTLFFSHALVPPRIEKPEGGAKVVIDTRRQWLHVAIGSTLRTYHLHSGTLILQREYGGRIECLERDSRLDVLLIVVREAGERTLYLSRDGGDTAQEVLRMTTAGLVVCTISPHGTWCAFYQSAGGALLVRHSRDGGATWSAALQVQVDGTSASGVPLDATYDARYNALVLAYEDASGNRRVARSHDDGESFVTILS
jgi:hypothetical protein